MPLDWLKKKGKKSASSPANGAGIGQLLGEDLVVLSPDGMDKDKLIDLLARRVCERRSLGDPAPFISKVMEREQGISTTLDTGLAVPHARMDGLKDIAAILGLVPQGIPDPKQPDLVIRAMFLFFSPNRQESFTRHLHLLRAVSAMFQPAFIDELLRDPSAARALRLIRSKETAS